MATISFDRELRIPKEDLDRFLEAIEKPSKPINDIPDIEEKLKEGERSLRKYLLSR